MTDYWIKYRARLKQTVFDHYGRVCACCGETEEKFLTLDHVNDDGAEHRKSIGRRNIYKDLIDRGFPDFIQVLCWNCNCGRKENGGVCPHKES